MENKPKIKRKWYVDLDPELVIKNLLFFSLYCLILIFSFNYFILPSIKDYKLAILDEKKQKLVYNTVLSNFNKTQGGFSLLKQRNEKFLETLEVSVTSQKIHDFLLEFFEDVVITGHQSKENQEKNFLETDFEIQAKAKDLQAIQIFFNALKDSPINLRVSIPFVIQKQEKGFFVAFKLKNKKNTYKLLQ
ncbi:MULTISPECIES: hypothetical protein [unclassified Helicobacter]|uniref:hypothetical protein n=1 Tax=unclassified Helicobacter TaxID=2593540 RepID=UPI000CF09A74|nr:MULTISPECIES: hypothetical protein [unclassified Helicobacter]